MWPALVVVAPPGCHLHPCFCQARESVLVQALVTGLAAERLDEGVLCRLARLDQLELEAVAVSPLVEHLAGELRPLVGADRYRHPTANWCNRTASTHTWRDSNSPLERQAKLVGLNQASTAFRTPIPEKGLPVASQAAVLPELTFLTLLRNPRGHGQTWSIPCFSPDCVYSILSWLKKTGGRLEAAHRQ